MTSHYQVPLVPNNLAKPPELWNCQEVKSWVEFCVQHYGLRPVCKSNFDMNGRGLCLLKRVDFQERAPQCGDVLFNAFQKLLSQADPRMASGHMMSSRGSSSTYIPILPQPLGEEGPDSCRPEEGSPLVPSSLLSPVPTERYSSDSESSPHDPSFSPRLVGMDGKDMAVMSHDPDDEDAMDTCAMGHMSQDSGRLLWEFIYQLLSDDTSHDLLSWEDQNNLTFSIKNPASLAEHWGKHKNRSDMTYEKLSRALRYYYKKDILKKVAGKKLTYKFLLHPSKIRKGQRGARPHHSRRQESLHENRLSFPSPSDPGSPEMKPCHQELSRSSLPTTPSSSPMVAPPNPLAVAAVSNHCKAICNNNNNSAIHSEEDHMNHGISYEQKFTPHTIFDDNISARNIIDKDTGSAKSENNGSFSLTPRSVSPNPAVVEDCQSSFLSEPSSKLTNMKTSPHSHSAGSPDTDSRHSPDCFKATSSSSSLQSTISFVCSSLRNSPSCKTSEACFDQPGPAFNMVDHDITAQATPTSSTNPSHTPPFTASNIQGHRTESGLPSFQPDGPLLREGSYNPNSFPAYKESHPSWDSRSPHPAHFHTTLAEGMPHLLRGNSSQFPPSESGRQYSPINHTLSSYPHLPLTHPQHHQHPHLPHSRPFSSTPTSPHLHSPRQGTSHLPSPPSGMPDKFQDRQTAEPPLSFNYPKPQHTPPDLITSSPSSSSSSSTISNFFLDSPKPNFYQDHATPASHCPVTRSSSVEMVMPEHTTNGLKHQGGYDFHCSTAKSRDNFPPLQDKPEDLSMKQTTHLNDKQTDSCSSPQLASNTSVTQNLSFQQQQQQHQQQQRRNSSMLHPFHKQ